jgi:hypothetical protein
MKRLTLALATLLFLAAPAFARSVADVDVPETLSVEGKSLKLNGAGIRKKFIIKVYVGALYLESNSTDAAAILKGDGAWAVRMIFLREVDKEKVIGGFKEGFEKNSPSKAASLQPSLDKLIASLGEMKKGTVMTVSYAPGKGTTVAVQGGPTVTIEGKDFGDAMLANWLGGKPGDPSLKTELLAGK